MISGMKETVFLMTREMLRSRIRMTMWCTNPLRVRSQRVSASIIRNLRRRDPLPRIIPVNIPSLPRKLSHSTSRPQSMWHWEWDCASPV